MARNDRENSLSLGAPIVGCGTMIAGWGVLAIGMLLLNIALFAGAVWFVLEMLQAYGVI